MSDIEPGTPERAPSGPPLRTLRRAEPRATIALAGAGCALAVVGALTVAGDNAGFDDDALNRWPGLVLSALLVAAGIGVLTKVRSGPLATAGTVAFALGVPPLMFFLTLDGSSLPPYSTEGILVVSTVAWLGAWAVGPARGRPFLLGAGLVGLWATVLQLVEGVFSAPFDWVAWVGGGQYMEPDPFGPEAFGPDPFGATTFDAPDPTSVGVISLLAGVGYLVLARWFDRSGREGAGTPCIVAVVLALTVAVLSLAGELQEVGTGLLLVALGAAMGLYGASVGRRATTWIGAAAATLGVAVALSALTDDATLLGAIYVAAGAGVVGLGHAIASSLDEPDEHVPGPSTFRRRDPQPPAPPPPPAPPSGPLGDGLPPTPPTGPGPPGPPPGSF